jgi:hypothetical protein
MMFLGGFMLFESLSWVILTFTLLVALPGALASPAPKKAKKTTSTRVTVEVYPAMEDGEIVVPKQASIPALEPAALPSAPQVAEAPKAAPAKKLKSRAQARTNARVQTLGAEAPVSTPIAAAPTRVARTAPPVTRATKFEVVPTEKRAEIVRRMNLCQTLFEESGRAYDYRIMTTQDLERELSAVRAGTAVAIQEPILNPDLSTSLEDFNEGPDPILDAQE